VTIWCSGPPEPALFWVLPIVTTSVVAHGDTANGFYQSQELVRKPIAKTTRAPENLSEALVLRGCGGPQPLAGKQVARLLLRDRDLNACFSRDYVFTKCLSSFALTASTPPKHAPLKLPEHSLRHIRSSMCSGGRGTIQLRADPKDTQTTAPGLHHVIDATRGRPPRPFRNVDAPGSGPAAAVPTMLGVSISQHCPGRCLDPTLEPWPSSERSTGPATPSTSCSIRSSPSTWKPSWARRRRLATGRASRSSSSASSGSS